MVDQLIEKLNIDETLTTPVRKEKRFTTFYENLVPLQDFNLIADLLFLPKTKKGYKYLLVVLDLWSKRFDIEQLKDKKPNNILVGLLKIFRRPYIHMPHGSIQTDGGTEFKGNVSKFLFENNIIHKITRKGRHTQMSPVDNLNKDLTRVFIGYMNKKEEETGERYNEWTDIVNYVRSEFNAHKKTRKDLDPRTYDAGIMSDKQPKYNIGDYVHVKLDVPRDALNNEQSTQKFRTGDYRFDKTPRKITNILYYTGDIPHRYMVDGIDNASYTKRQLIKSSYKGEQKYDVKKIIGKKKINNKIHYLVHWKGYKKKDSTWEPKDNLIEDGLLKHITDYEKKNA